MTLLSPKARARAPGFLERWEFLNVPDVPIDVPDHDVGLSRDQKALDYSSVRLRLPEQVRILHERSDVKNRAVGETKEFLRDIRGADDAQTAMSQKLQRRNPPMVAESATWGGVMHDDFVKSLSTMSIEKLKFERQTRVDRIRRLDSEAAREQVRAEEIDEMPGDPYDPDMNLDSGPTWGYVSRMRDEVRELKRELGAIERVLSTKL